MGNSTSSRHELESPAVWKEEVVPDTTAASSSCASDEVSDVLSLNEEVMEDTNCMSVFPLFAKKTSALHVLDDEDSARSDNSRSQSCFPRLTTGLSNDVVEDADTTTNGSSRTGMNINVLASFRSCKEGVLLQVPNQQEGDISVGCSNASTGSSWANLVGLEELEYTPDELLLDEEPTPESDLRPLREYWIVTTAALPWMTGTAVNPLLRAAYLSQRNRRLFQADSTVTLALPWLEEPSDRVSLYGQDWEDSTPDDQEHFIRNWLKESAKLPDEADRETGIIIQWYPARYHAALSSIFAMGDLCELVSESESKICILEEPEHVNFYRAPGRLSWRDKFPHVIGIVHTNYKAYATNHYSGLLTGPLIGALSSLMVRAYCDKVVKLSPVLQSYAPYKEVVSNVHGIRQEFVTVPQRSTKRIYFIGKLLWAKGLDKLLDLQGAYRKQTGSYFEMDIFGSGPQQEEIQEAFLGKNYWHADNSSTANSTNATEQNSMSMARYWRRFRQPIPAKFLGRKDHAAAAADYQIFVNPSITEVLCTTTAEAVAMGKWVIIPRHDSNEFFLPFSNCLQYSNRHEFVKVLKHCLRHDPPGWQSGDHTERMESLSWEAATQRMIDTSYLSNRDAKRCERLQPKDRTIQEWHYALGKGTRGDMFRKVMGAGPVAEQSQYRYSSSLSLTSLDNER
eukprot:Nitzschia sp. Nitz4//scaffold26_size159584//103796//105835//NITZ4_002501-RA/size159584-processed-gene-0.237-mRNA-1//-1//CDS//3329545112//1832//frame0